MILSHASFTKLINHDIKCAMASETSQSAITCLTIHVAAVIMHVSLLFSKTQILRLYSLKCLAYSFWRNQCFTFYLLCFVILRIKLRTLQHAMQEVALPLNYLPSYKGCFCCCWFDLFLVFFLIILFIHLTS